MRMRPSVIAGLLPALLVPVLLPACGGDDEGGTQPEACSIDIFLPDHRSLYAIPAQEGRPNRIDVSWHDAGGGDVSIELLKDGTAIGTVVDAAANDGDQHFYINDGNDFVKSTGSDYQVRVTSLDDPACTDTSERFTIQNFEGCGVDVRIAYPGDDLADPVATAGTQMGIDWIPTAGSGAYDVELWKDPPGVDESLVGVLAEGTTEVTLDWTIDSLNQGDSWYKIRVRDADITSCTGDSPVFRMVDDYICSIVYMGPVIQGTEQEVEIVWTSEKTTGSVNLELWYGQVNRIETLNRINGVIVPVPAAQESFLWTVRDYGYSRTGPVYKIRIVDAQDEYCYGFSDLFPIP